MTLRTTRVTIVWLIIVTMVALQFNVWMAGEVQPLVLGVPSGYWYFQLYGMLSILAVWLIMRLVWPRDERAANEGPMQRASSHASDTHEEEQP